MTPEKRHEWAVELMAIRSNDDVLEIGCGTGITAGLVADKLKKGHIVAIDRSETQIKKSIKRNDLLIKEGKATFLVGNFHEVDLPKQSFTKVYAFNVSLFWKNPEKELSVIRKHLKAGGVLFIFYQPPKEVIKNYTEATSGIVEKNGFKIERKIYQPISCIVDTSEH